MESPANRKEECSEKNGSGSLKLDSKTDIGRNFSPETVTEDNIKDERVTAADAALQESSKQETSDMNSQINLSLVETAVGDTRLIPSRPITPFCSKEAPQLREQEDEHLSLSSADFSHPVSVHE